MSKIYSLIIVQESEDGTNICYQIIGIAIAYRDPDIGLQAGQLLNIIKHKAGINMDWLLRN